MAIPFADVTSLCTNSSNIGRIAGWIAHALEQTASGAMIRPRARYIGPTPRHMA